MPNSEKFDLFQTSRTIWVVLCVATLLTALIIQMVQPKLDVIIILLIPMIILCLPISLFWEVSFVFFGTILPIPIHSSYLQILYLWSTCFTLGLLQWYVFPLALKRWKQLGTFSTKAIEEGMEINRPILELPKEGENNRLWLAVLATLVAGIAVMLLWYAMAQDDRRHRSGGEFELVDE